jgi:hypothetical protein
MRNMAALKEPCVRVDGSKNAATNTWSTKEQPKMKHFELEQNIKKTHLALQQVSASASANSGLHLIGEFQNVFNILPQKTQTQEPNQTDSQPNQVKTHWRKRTTRRMQDMKRFNKPCGQTVRLTRRVIAKDRQRGQLKQRSGERC